MDFSKLELFAFTFAASLLLFIGCVPLENNGGTTSSVSGTVNTKSFFVESGSAEETSPGTYVITLADTVGYSCNSTEPLPDSYLTLVIANVDDAPMTYQAADTVTFNDFENDVAVPENATSGTVTIDAIDDFGGVIEGSIDASGPNSEVSGTFDVEICL